MPSGCQFRRRVGVEKLLLRMGVSVEMVQSFPECLRKSPWNVHCQCAMCSSCPVQCGQKPFSARPMSQ
eukprot:3551331-Rhodomonas_salina.1